MTYRRFLTEHILISRKPPPKDAHFVDSVTLGVKILNRIHRWQIERCKWTTWLNRMIICGIKRVMILSRKSLYDLARQTSLLRTGNASRTRLVLGSLAIIATFTAPIPSAYAEEICIQCNLSWSECVGGTRSILESCMQGITRACQSSCASKTNDNQGFRNSTRFATCVRNCSRSESCDFDQMRNLQRCNSLRSVCRRDRYCMN